MALTITNVSTPMSGIQEMSLPPYKARIINLVFGTGYPTGGETLTASALGWTQIFGFINLNGIAANATGTQGYVIEGIPQAGNKSIKVVAQQVGAAVSTPLAEAANATNLTGFTHRVMVIGF